MTRCMCGATDCPSCGPAQGYPWPPAPEDEPADELEASGDRICTYCGQAGHRAHACPRRFITELLACDSTI